MARSTYEEEVISEIAARTPQEWKSAFLKLKGEQKITKNQWKMLCVHYEAPHHTLTHRQLARKARIKGGYPAVNSQYGRLAHLLWECLRLPPPPQEWNRGRWINALEEWFERRGGEWEGTMRPNLAKALKQIGWYG